MQNFIISTTHFDCLAEDENELRGDIKQAVEGVSSLFFTSSSVITNVTTHLICSRKVRSAPTTKCMDSKARASIKIISLEWLLECLSHRDFVSEADFIFSAPEIKSKTSVSSEIQQYLENKTSEDIEFYATQYSQNTQLKVESQSKNGPDVSTAVEAVDKGAIPKPNNKEPQQLNTPLMPSSTVASEAHRIDRNGASKLEQISPEFLLSSFENYTVRRSCK